MSLHLSEEMVVEVSWCIGGRSTTMRCVVTGVHERFIEFMPVGPSSAPPVDTLVEFVTGGQQIRATVQSSKNELFAVLRPVDVFEQSVASSTR